MDERFWASPGAVTQVGTAGAAVDGISPDIADLRRTSCQLVFHYFGDGDFAENGIAQDRVHEIDTRYADVMFDRLAELGGEVFPSNRPPAQRVVGCCRDFTLLFVAMARHKGIPARSRVGFATYFVEGWFIDHVIAEIWDAAEGRWRLVEPQVSDDFARNAGFDPLDVPSSSFLTGGEAWLEARAGQADPERFVVMPDLDIPDTRGWRYLRHHLIHDLVALNKQEMVLWDQWGLMDQHADPGEQECALLDDLAQVVSAPEPSSEELLAWGARDEFRVPGTVTSYSPAEPAPLTVDVRRVTEVFTEGARG